MIFVGGGVGCVASVTEVLRVLEHVLLCLYFVPPTRSPERLLDQLCRISLRFSQNGVKDEARLDGRTDGRIAAPRSSHVSFSFHPPVERFR